MADTTVSIGADLNDLRRELAKLPNLSGEAAQKTLIQVEKAVKKAESAAKRATKSVKRSAKEAQREAKQAAEETSRGLKGVYELAGGSGETIEKLGNVLGALSNPAVAAAAGLGVAAAAATGMVSGMFAAVAAAEDFSESLEPLERLEGFGGLDPKVMGSINSATSSMDALGAITKQAVVTLGAEFAPTVERVGTLMVKLALMGMDAWQSFTDGKSVLERFADFAAVKLVRAITAPADALSRLTDTFAVAARVMGQDELADKLNGVRESYLTMTSTLAHQGVDVAMEELGDAVGKVERATGNYDERARELLDTMTKLRLAGTDGAKAAEEQARAYEEAAALVSGLTTHRLSEREKLDQEEQAALQKLIDTNVATEEQIQAVRAEFHARRLDLVEEEKEAHQDALDAKLKEEEKYWKEIERQEKEAETRRQAMEAARLSAAKDLTASTLDLVATIANAEAEASNKSAKQRKRAAMVAFAATKASAVAQVAVDTAAAVSKVNATWAAVPPMAATLSAAAIGIGLAQGAAIMASPPPKFHSGGLVSADPSERAAVVRTGEYVATPQQVANLGGPAAMDAARGSSGGGMVIQQSLVLRGTTLDRTWHEVQQTGGRVSKALRTLRPPMSLSPYPA